MPAHFHPMVRDHLCQMGLNAARFECLQRRRTALIPVTGGANDCAFSPKGDSLAIVIAGCDKTLRIWDADTSRQLRSLTGHTDWVNRCVVSTDGTRNPSLPGGIRPYACGMPPPAAYYSPLLVTPAK